MVECSGIAGQWNVHRSKTTDRVWMYTDFHPAHLGNQKKKPNGRKVVRDAVVMFGGDMVWAEGYGPEKI